jgi:PAS domain S-box-containing protein
LKRLVAAYLSRYQAALADYLSTDDELLREAALMEATEVGKSAAAENTSIDEMRELHRLALAAVARPWRDAAGSSPAGQALARLRRGDAGPFGIAFVLPQELVELRRHEQRWRREQGKLLALFEQTDDLIIVLDGQGCVESVNPAFTRLTGWSELEAVTQMAAIWRGPLPLKTTRHLRSVQSCRDGSSVTVEWSISPIFDGGQVEGGLLCHVCIGRDITFEQQTEDSLRENDKLRSVATLAACIAHDFNNLLGSILGLAELCELDAVAGSRQARNLGRIRQAGDKAAGLVRQMLDFSRQTPRTPQLLRMSALLEHAEGLLRAALPQGVQLDAVVLQDAQAMIDLVQMEQVLLNMTRNAAQAMRDCGGTVRVLADCADPGTPATASGAAAGAVIPARHVRLRVADQGQGIAPALLPRIFEPFFTTKPVGEGTGLGLAAVHGIVSNHGGTVEVASEPGAGTTFSVFLPLAGDQGSDAAPAQVAAVMVENA